MSKTIAIETTVELTERQELELGSKGDTVGRHIDRIIRAFETDAEREGGPEKVTPKRITIELGHLFD